MAQNRWRLMIPMVVWFGAIGASAREPSVSLRLEKAKAFLGETINLTIEFRSDSKPLRPDLTALQKDFQVHFQGDKLLSNTQITMQGRFEDTRYIFTYGVTPLRTGTLQIPSMTVTVQNRTLQTNPAFLKVVEPTETEDCKLRLRGVPKEAYLGERIQFDLVCYLSTSLVSRIREGKADLPRFTIPWLASSLFSASPLWKTKPTQQGRSFLSVELNGNTTAFVEESIETLEGQKYLAIILPLVLYPKKEGRADLSSATAGFREVTGYTRKRGPIGFTMRQPVFRTQVVPSMPQSIEVRGIPKEGRPTDFSGLVGQYRLECEATPTRVSVGEPIEVTLRVFSDSDPTRVAIASLDHLADLTGRFKVTAESGTVTKHEDHLAFQQILRPLHDGVNEIPSFQLSYFDPVSQRYRFAQTNAIPLQVTGTRKVTALDAEGVEGPSGGGTKLSTFSAGIAHNYDDHSVLEQQAYGPETWTKRPLWGGLLIGLPLVYLFAWLADRSARKRNDNPSARRKRAAFKRFQQALQGGTDANRGLGGFQHYLADKSDRPAGSFTVQDAARLCEAHDVPEALSARVASVLEHFEASRFGAPVNVANGESPAELLELARSLEEYL